MKDGIHLSDGTYAEVCGSGPAVIFIHGLGLDRSIWSEQVAAFADSMTIVTYDLVGHGRSARPEVEHSVDLYAKQLKTLMDELSIARAVVVGFSLGGLIVRGFALKHPDRVAGVGIMNTWFQRTESETLRVADRMAAAAEAGPTASIEPALIRWFSDDYRNTNPAVLDKIATILEANDPVSYISAYRVAAERGTPAVEDVEKISCPTLVMTCDGDRGNSPGMAMRMAENIPDSEVVILPGLRHMALLENAPLVNAPLGRLFDRVHSRESAAAPAA